MTPIDEMRLGDERLVLGREDGGRYVVMLNGLMVSESDTYLCAFAELRRRREEVRQLLIRRGMGRGRKGAMA